MSAAQSPSAKPPVVVIQDSYETDSDVHKKKRAKTSSSNNNNNNGSSKSKQKQSQQPPIFHPSSNTLLDDMLHPLPRNDFLRDHFRKDAVHIQRQPRSLETEMMVSDICHNYLFDLDVRQIFAETSSENVFLWLRPPPPVTTTDAANIDKASSPSAATLNSVEIPDSETAYALHKSGSHPAYCRAPPLLEQHLVGSLLRATGLGGGHYHPPHAEIVTLGGGTTLGRGEVELFIATSSSKSKISTSQAEATLKEKKHTTGWHTDFQENFTIQLSGVKRWTLRRGRVQHPLRATTPHYARDPCVVENQLKVARLSCLAGNAAHEVESNGGGYGFEYGGNNACGPEQTVILYPGDVLYFPAGMWHRVETVEPGISCNTSLMGTTYASLVSEALQHLMVGSDEGWREVVTSRPGEKEDGTNKRLQGLLGGLSKLVDDFVTKQGGAQSLLPPALCHPPLGNDEEESSEDSDGSEGKNDHDSNEEEDQSNSDEKSAGQMDEQIEEDSDNEEEEAPSSGIIIPMDDFEGPPGWTCSRPPNSKLVKNPLASLISMSDITGVGNHAQKQETKQYVLNVNYAGNEMMESYIRVILETANSELMDEMDWYMSCEAQGQGPGHTINNPNENGASLDGVGRLRLTPPLCLFYYGYFCWSVPE